MGDCWGTPTHPWQGGGRNGGAGAGAPVLLRRDGQLPSPTFAQGRRTTLLVDSRDRDYDKYPTPSRYVVKLPETLHNVTNAVLISAELPATYYVFAASKGNTTIKVTVSGVTKDVTVPDGNYTFTTMAAALKAALEAQFAGVTFAVTFDPATFKCRMAATPTSTAWSIDCTGVTGYTQWGLGYFLGLTRDAVTTSTSGVIQASTVANMNPEMYFLIDIEELNAVSEAAMYAGGGSRGCFAKVPLMQPTFEYSFYDKTLVCNDLRPPRARLEKLTVSIRFHDGTLVDFHDAEHSMTLELTCTNTRFD
jgi:hypothetical protein